MDLFAHGGVNHATTAEAASHSAGTFILTLVLVSIGVAALLAGVIFLLNKFSIIALPLSGKDQK